MQTFDQLTLNQVIFSIWLVAGIVCILMAFIASVPAKKEPTVGAYESQIKTLKAQRDDAEKDAARLYFHLQNHTGACERGCQCEQCAVLDAHEARMNIKRS